RRIEVDVEGAGNRAQAGKLCTAHGRHQRRVDDADAFHWQWAKARKVNAHCVFGDLEDAPRSRFVIRPKDRTNYNLADLFLFRARIAAAANFARAANRGAHLLNHVRQQAGFLRIDFRHGSFEFDLELDHRTWRDGVTQVNAQSCFLIVESKWDGRAVACGANFHDFKKRLVGNEVPGRRLLCWRRVTRKANVRIKMKEKS